MKKIIPIIIGAVIVAGIIAVLLGQSAISPTPTKQESISDTKYVEANSLLKEKLGEKQIRMSSPIKIGTPEGIKKYCTFFASSKKQNLVQYCTSTELKNQNGTFLGNIHMVGAKDSPGAVLTLIQTDKSMSNLDTAKTIFTIVSDTMICDCWSEKKPGGLDSMNSWVDGLKQFHQSDTKPHSKSNLLQFEDKAIQLELTTNDDGYLWQFIIYN
ncbi:MAG: hypothetical protein EB153_02330 [Nitrosopumilaceae archaeon]|nr:hypothetical protein [Nitrosopumilaceae archaeon]